MCLIGLTFSCTEDLPQDTSFLTSISKKRANITDSLYIDLHSDIASLGETIEPDVSYPKKLANATYYIIGNLGTPPEYTNKYGTLTCTQGAIFTREKLGGIENSSIKARLELLLPGEWFFKVVVVKEQDTFDSPTEDIEIQFPRYSDIEEALTEEMEEVWYETLLLTSKDSRCEEAFWIYSLLDGEGYEIVKGETEYGNSNSSCETGSNSSLNPSNPEIIVPKSLGEKSKFPIAYFHTHTPMTYCPPEKKRDTGFSSGDLSFSDRHELPLFLYDYSAIYIEGGHDLYDPATISHNTIERRKTPKTWNDLYSY